MSKLNFFFVSPSLGIFSSSKNFPEKRQNYTYKVLIMLGLVILFFVLTKAYHTWFDLVPIKFKKKLIISKLGSTRLG